MTFFIDRSLGGRLAVVAHSHAGFEVVAHDDAFAADTADETWLAEVGERGWIVLMKDDRIRYRPPFLRKLYPRQRLPGRTGRARGSQGG